MNRTNLGWAASLAGLLMVATLGCADESPDTTSASPAATAEAVAADGAPAAPAGAKVKEVKVVDAGPKLPEGKVEQRVASPNGLAHVVFVDEGESGDWFWRSLYVTSGAKHMDLGNYTDLSEVKWSADGQDVTAKVKAGTDYNKLTTYLLHYRLGADAFHLEELKVETVESAG